MTLLSDRDILAARAAGEFDLSPWVPAVQPASVDVHLSNLFRTLRTDRVPHIDPSTEQPGQTSMVEPAPGKPFHLAAGQFVLASTVETVTLSASIAARLEGKSSLGRLGLAVHSTAGFIDPGFRGTVTLELSNLTATTILLWPGMRIGQLCLFRLSSPAESRYGSRAAGSRYQDQNGPTESRSWDRWSPIPLPSRQ